MHHFDFYECDSTVIFDDNKLPDGLCDEIADDIEFCSYSVLVGWSVGADTLSEFPEEAGYGFGGHHEIKYYMTRIHYNNPRLSSSTLTFE